MGEKPTPKHSIDRIDVNGNYDPSNCKWVTQSAQVKNTRIRRDNKTGMTGVKEQKGKWVASIQTDGSRMYLGIYSDFFEACCIRKSAENKYWRQA